MDVISLLNTAARSSFCKQSIENTISIPDEAKHTSQLTSSPTPSPGRTFQSVHEMKSSRSRTPWNAGGYTLPQCMESRFQSRLSFSAPAHEQEPSSSHRTLSKMSSQSRHDSTDSPIDHESPGHSAPLTGLARVVASADRSHRDPRMESARTIYQNERGSYSREPSLPPRHRFSDSGSSFSSYESSQSGYHSRLSSVTSVSGVSSFSLSITELPPLGPRLADESSQMLGGEEAESPTSLPEERTTTTPDESDETERPRSPSDAVLNLKGLTKSLLVARSPLHTSLRPNRPFTTPRFHKRAISAPDCTSRSAFASSGALKSWYPVLPPLEAMDATRGGQTPDEAEESGSTMITPHAQNIRQGRRESAPQQATGLETDINPSSTPESGPGCLDLSPAVGYDSTPTLAQGIFPDPPSTTLHNSALVSPEPVGKEPCCMFVSNCNTGSQLRKAISHLFGRNKACTLRIPKEIWVYYCRKHYQRIRYRNAKTYPLNQMDLVKMQIKRIQSWSDANKRKGDGPFIELWTLSLRKREQNRLEKGDGEDDCQTPQGSSPAPDWLIERLGTGYTTQQMLEVANRLHEEINHGNLAHVPEIEFLPDITDPEENASSKPAKLRKHNRTTSENRAPKRKASEATNAFESTGPSGRDENDEHSSPLEKRQRLDSGHGHHHRPSSHPLAPTANMSHYVDGHHASLATGAHTSPTLALPVVPRMQPLAYAYGHPPSGHSRAGSLSGAFDQGQQASTYYQFGVDAAQPPSLRWNREYDGRPRLPSISAHLPQDYEFHASPSTHPSYTSHVSSPGYGYHRPGHHRAVSAYTPARQSGMVYTRPASSGNGAQPGLPHFDNRAVGPSAYEAETQGFSRDPWAGQDYGYAPAWNHSFAAGYAPQQQPYQYAPMYDPALRTRMDNQRVPPPFADRPSIASETVERESHISGVWHRIGQSTDNSPGEDQEN